MVTEWHDEFDQPWLDRVPRFKLLGVKKTQKPPRPISWQEQEQLFALLPEYLREASLFLVNTGIREANARRLRWEWEVRLNDDRSLFVIPKQYVKNKSPRIVVLNDIAQAIVERQRGKHETVVFTYQGQPIRSALCNSAWYEARKRLGLGKVRVHDLKHTFGVRLRAANVSFEDRQDLLGHKSQRITTHYSAAKIEQLIEAANKVTIRNETDDLSVSIQAILSKAS